MLWFIFYEYAFIELVYLNDELCWSKWKWSFLSRVEKLYENKGDIFGVNLYLMGVGLWIYIKCLYEMSLPQFISNISMNNR